MKRFLCLLCTVSLFFPYSVFSWNALGHMVIANIAYINLKPPVRKKVDSLVAYFHHEYSEMISFQKVACWPDAIRSQKIETFTHWHYIDVPFSTDGSQLKNTIDTDNAVWALNKVSNVVKYQLANSYERVRFLAFLVHIVGDLHQPLHTVTHVSMKNPDGDKGGNLYFVRYNNERMNLHKLWDSGAGIFNAKSTIENANTVADKIMEVYPPKFFGSRINDLDFENWAKEGMINAKQFVYATPENQNVDDNYIENARKLSRQEVALAGYRLAALLNQLLE